MAIDPGPAIAVLATSKYRAEALALAISAHSKNIAFPLIQGESALPARCSTILVEFEVSLESAIQLVRDTSVQHPDATLVVLGVAESEENIVKLAEAGASGYVPANASFREMLSIVESAQKGEFACPPDITYVLFSRLARLAQNSDVSFLRPSGLTIRERQVRGLLAQRLSNKEIANRLCVSEYTVKNHVHHLLQKLGVHSRRAAAQLLAESVVTTS
jgi:two-component system nitrate/nitrite response regulator NarL